MITSDKKLFIKGILTLILATSWCLLSAQPYSTTIKGKVLLPQLDSMVIDLNRLYVNPENIKAMSVLKNPDSLSKKKFKGAIGTIEFKKLPELIPVNNLKLEKFNTSPLAPLYFIDGVILGDTTGVKVDKLHIKKLEAINSEKNVTFNKWSIVYILTTGNKGAQAASNKVKKTLNTKLPF
jgi:hypothetical protein